MSSKNFLLFLLLISFVKVYSTTGEIFVSVSSGQSFTLVINTTEPSWDYINGQIVQDQTVYPKTYTGNNIKFDAPKSQDSGTSAYELPWGIFSFTFIINGDTTTVYIDFRDEQWSTDEVHYNPHDAYIYYDLTEGEVKVSVTSNKTTPLLGDVVYGIWSFWNGVNYTPQKENFIIPVTFSNKIENTTTNIGGYLYSNGTQVNSGVLKNTYGYTPNMVSEGTKEYTDVQRKYSFNWTYSLINPETVGNIYSSQLIYNHNRQVGNREVTRNFRNVYPLTAKNLLPEAGSQSYDYVYFKDPTTTNTFNLTSAAGSGFVKNETFADLHITVNNIPEQKYSLKAKSSITYNGKTYNWYAGDFNPNTQTDMLITAATTKSAYYKGHMLTSNNKGFSPTGQAKFIMVDASTGYFVYESMGKVWMVKGTGIGGSNPSFGQEVLVSESDDYSYENIASGKNPCIASADENHIYVVYQGCVSGGDTGPLIFKVYQPTTTGVNRIFRTVVQEDLPYSNDAKPTIAVRGTTLSIVFKPSATAQLKDISYSKDNSTNPATWDFGESFTLPFTSSTSINPSLVWSSPLGSKYCLIYQNSNTSVEYVEYTSPTSYSKTVLSASNGYTYNYNPGIKLTNLGYPLVYWVARTQYPSILIKYRSSSTSWTTTYSTGGFSEEPAVGAAFMEDAAVISWYNGYGQYLQYIKRWPSTYTSTGYSSVKSLSYQASPQLADGLYLSNVEGTLFYNLTGGSVYAIDNWNYNFQTEMLGKEGEAPTTYGRSIVVNKKGIEHVFYLGDIKLNGNNVMFVTRPDTLPVNSALEATKAMTTESINLKSGDKLELSYYYYTLNQSLKDSLKASEYVQFSLEAVNKENGNAVSLSKVKFTKDNLQDSTEQIIKIGTENLSSGSYEFRLSLDVIGEASYSLMDHQNTFNGEKLAKEQAFDLTAEMQLPSVYALSQNYPNPFNPSTVIRYDIPQDSRVTLKVYDMLGQEVATLVDDFKTAGRYNVTFNASHLSTGVYIYQLRAGDYVSVKKMSFVK